MSETNAKNTNRAIYNILAIIVSGILGPLFVIIFLCADPFGGAEGAGMGIIWLYPLSFFIFVVTGAVI